MDRWARVEDWIGDEIGTSSCTVLTPMFPPAAFNPSAKPFSRFGKKNEMLAMLQEKLPPPSPCGRGRQRHQPERRLWILYQHDQRQARD
jgi:hypothetical protein